jgi:FlaA1/EpsC-like NDP-sugar epimerase
LILPSEMIRLSDLELGCDVEITFTGIRAGEGLHEILFPHEEPSKDIGIAGIVAAQSASVHVQTGPSTNYLPSEADVPRPTLNLRCYVTGGNFCERRTHWSLPPLSAAA